MRDDSVHSLYYKLVCEPVILFDRSRQPLVKFGAVAGDPRQLFDHFKIPSNSNKCVCFVFEAFSSGIRLKLDKGHCVKNFGSGISD